MKLCLKVLLAGLAIISPATARPPIPVAGRGAETPRPTAVPPRRSRGAATARPLSQALPVTRAPETTEIPWSVLIELHSSNGIEQCTGSALTAHWIVTAAHCLRHHSVQGTQAKILYVDNAGVKQVAYGIGPASFYNHPDWGGPGAVRIIADRSDDLGLIRLYGVGMAPEQKALIYADPRKPWDYAGTPEADIYVAGYGSGSGLDGEKKCADVPQEVGTKRLGRVALTGDHDDDGFFGTGPTISVQARRKYSSDICGGDSGAPWSLLRADRYMLLGIHSGNRQSLSWTSWEWAALVDPKLDWILKTTKAKGLAIECPKTSIRDHRNGADLSVAYRICRDII